MIEKKLIHFSKENSYQTNKNQIKDNSIVWVSESKKIITHGTEYQFCGWDILEEPQLLVGDCILYDAEKNIIVNSKVGDLHKLDNINYIPIGVIVVPSEHKIYGDNSASMISLCSMDVTNPENGDSRLFNNPTETLTDDNSTKIKIGHYGTDIALPYYTVGAYINNGTVQEKYVVGYSANPYMPSDSFSNVQCLHDSNTYYYNNGSSHSLSPSPFLTNGFRNSEYSRIDENPLNCFSDFDGLGNTDVLTNDTYTKNQASWKTDDTIISEGSDGYSAAACCCRRFKTTGTNVGDWYLPSIGELGYMVARFSKIQESLNTLINIFGPDKCCLLNSNSYYWSSTQSSKHHARSVKTSNGRVGTDTKETSMFVRAFMKIKPI